MNRPSGPRKTASNLSESIHQQLSTYALAAGAAGVSVLAMAQPLEAKIVYTPTHVVIGRNGYDGIDFNDDGIIDVRISQACTAILRECYLLAGGSGIEEGTQGHGWAAALKAGASIGHTKAFRGLAKMDFCHDRCSRQYGYWTYSHAHYLGVEFHFKGKTHFGWARFKNCSAFGATLTGYAYETIAGKSIKAGQTKSSADEWEQDFGPGASQTNPIPDTPQPASLGMLALGAQGVPLWRRKESTLEGALS